MARLRRAAPLTDAEVGALESLPFTRKMVEPNAYLVREGERPFGCAVLVRGFAFRQKLVSDGARQIVSIGIPGEAIDLQNLYLTCSDHNAQALTRAELAIVPHQALRALVRQYPGIAEVVAKTLLIEGSIFREWIVNIGQRDARTRLAHLLCEFAVRLEDAGLATDGRYELPMTQEQLGDATGMTSVHVNRSLRALEKDGLIQRTGRSVTFPDTEALWKAGDFSALYLHRPDMTGR